MFYGQPAPKISDVIVANQFFNILPLPQIKNNNQYLYITTICRIKWKYKTIKINLQNKYLTSTKYELSNKNI